MMKTKVLAIAVSTLLAVVSTPALAGGIGVMVGTWDTENAEDDQGGGVKLELGMGENIDLEFRASWFDGFVQANDGFVYRIEALPVDIGVAYNFLPGHKLNPYAGVGGTYLFISPQEARGQEFNSRPRSQEEAGYYLEVGLELQVSRNFSVFAEGLYRSIKGEVRGARPGHRAGDQLPD